MKRANVLYLTVRVLSALLITLVALSIQASESITIDLTDTENAWLSAHKTIRIGVDPAYPPFEFINEAGRYNGMAADYLALISERLGVEFHVIPELTWSQAIEGGKARTLDLIPVITPTDERREFLNFTSPYLFYPQVIITRRDEAPVTDLADLVGKTMAVSKGYSEVKELKQRFPDINQLLVNNPLEELEAIATGQADAAQGNLAVASYFMQKHNLLNLKVAAPSDIEGGALALGVRGDWPELVSILNKALDSITLKEHQAIRSTWGMQTVEMESSPKIQLTTEEEEWLADNPVLSLGYDIDWPPVEYADEQGQHQGISTEYMALIAKSLGVTIEPAAPQSWRATIEAAKSGQLDILSAVARTPQRDEYLSFTTPYLRFPMVIVTGSDFTYIRDLNMLADNKIAVIDGYASHDFLINKYPELALFPVEDISKGLRAVRRGDADVFIDSLASVTHVMRREGISDLKISGEAPFSFDISIGIRKDRPILARLMQKALDAIPEEKRVEIFNRWVSVTYERGFDYALLWQILAVVIVVLAAFIYWNRHLEQMVRSRTHALQESEERLSSVLASAGTGIYAIDRQGVCLFCNPSSSQSLGYSNPDELIDKDIHALIHHHKPDGTLLPFTECPIHTTIISEMPQSGDDQIFWRADGSFFPVEFRAAPLYRNGEVIGATVSFFDITERKQAEEALRRSQKMDAIGQFTSGIAHDFNNLLGIVNGYTGLALNKYSNKMDEPLVKYLQNINDAAKRATNLVSQMLTFSRSDENNDKPLKLSLLIKEDIKLLRSTLPTSIEIETEIDPELPSVLMNPTQLHQILMNLSINARDAMDSVGKLRIQLRWAHGLNTESCISHKPILGDWIELCISDTGSGIAPEIVQHIFNPFFTTKEVGKGTGLGLSVIYGIMKNHGGHIMLESELGKGSTFHMLFPPILEGTDNFSGGDMEMEPISIPKGDGSEILVVDDEPMLAMHLSELVKDQGYETSMVTDSNEALEIFRQEPDRYSILITDQTMPKMTGMKLIEKLRAIRPELPVIMCSGYGDKIDVTSADELNIVYISKPVDTEKLLLKIAELRGLNS